MRELQGQHVSESAKVDEDEYWKVLEAFNK